MKKPILMIDDEPDCFEIFNSFIKDKKPDIPVFYAPHAEQAVEYVKHQMKHGGLYAIVCDNHLANEDNPDTIDGDEFLRTIQGYPDLSDLNLDISTIDFKDITDRKIRNFLKENFMDIEEYRRLVHYYFGDNAEEPLLMMICGAPREVNRACLKDVPIFLKTETGCAKIAKAVLSRYYP